MKFDENIKKSLNLANNATAVTDATFKGLLENCFSVLTGLPEPHNVTNLYNSKPDLVKELYAALLSITAEFVRSGQKSDSIRDFLNKCGYNEAKISFYTDLYDRNREEIEGSLINVGSHLPHITDVTWKIDYIIKSSCVDASEGPLFRIGLQTEKYNSEIGGKKVELVNFTCDSQELQDLVYKLKDAVRHCQRIGSEH
ncbi:hypothetical protein Zmor_018411 [Zophobas morio]|uniref:COMM domain-containing protein 3 n=1 Tax=Zophobas morio TaxID=2755281 RepID=A0AA38MDX8_9CUCU|nr:hypothetical protein Zmor_018411 [Zophobas morio]